MGPGRQLLLITKGRKSGEPRSVSLSYIEHGGDFIVVASNAGENESPAWWLNLRADPVGTVLVAGRSLPITAHEVEDPERPEVFARFVAEMGETYLEYQRRTTRRLPVVALTPTTM